MRDDAAYNRQKNAVYGFALGEAAGYGYRGKTRNEMRESPFTSLSGSAQWYDNTAFLLATFDGLKNGADYKGIMDRYKAYRDDGTYAMNNTSRYLSSIVKNALLKYDEGVDPVMCGGVDEDTWKNGSLLRMLPVAFYIYFDKDVDFIDSDQCFQFIENLSSLTHRAIICHIACAIFVNIALFLQEEKQQDRRTIVKLAVDKVLDHYRKSEEAKEFIGYYIDLSDDGFADTPEDKILSGSSVVHTLQASLWCFMNSDSYKDSVIRAVNLGGDTSAIAALAGSLSALSEGGYCEGPQNGTNEEGESDKVKSSISGDDLDWLPLLEERDKIEHYLDKD